MITVGMYYDVREGQEARFETAFANVIKALGKAAGHDFSRLYHAVDDPSSYLIISQWNDRRAFDEFIASDTFRSVTDWGKEQILTARPRHEVYES